MQNYIKTNTIIKPKQSHVIATAKYKQQIIFNKNNPSSQQINHLKQPLANKTTNKTTSQASLPNKLTAP